MTILLATLLLLMCAHALVAQDSTHTDQRNSMEIRAGSGVDGMTLTVEYRFRIVRHASIDASVWMNPFNAHIGFSVWPLEVVGAQLSAGHTSYVDAPEQAPRFEPQISIAATGMFRLPLSGDGRFRTFIVVLGGPVWYRDGDYIPESGPIYFPDGTPASSVETRMIGRLEIGAGVMF